MTEKLYYLGILAWFVLCIAHPTLTKDGTQNSLSIEQMQPHNGSEKPPHLSLIKKETDILPPQLPVSRPPETKTQDQQLINFSYVNTKITDIINDLAVAKDINIILPKMADKIEGAVTISLDYKISIPEAWNLLNTILDIAGYSIVLSGDMYQIVKNSKNITHEPVPLYIDTPLDQLPASGRIRYLTYLSNIKVGDAKAPNDEIAKILSELLPKPVDSSPENLPYKVDQATNALLIMAQAPDIKAVMQIIEQIDKPGFQEQLEIVKLRHTQARTVSAIFDEIYKSSSSLNRYHLDTQKPEDSYFLKTKIIPEDRTNSLIIAGRSQAVNRVKNFIYQYIDVELGSGKSILHVYQLQYLDAEEFKGVLEKVVKAEMPTGASQATTQKGVAVGPERFFEDVIIMSDTPPGAQQPPSTDTLKGANPTPYSGGNKLIIAARNDDWKRIKKLIEELDSPQSTVLLEVLIADLTIDDQRLLGSMMRNPAKIPFVNQAAIQSAQTNLVIPDSWANPQTIGFNQNPDGTTIASDLLRDAFNNAGGIEDNGTNSLAAAVPVGGTAISFNDKDGKTFALSQLVQLFGHDKILSHPHVIGTHNKASIVEIGEERLAPDTGSGGVGGTIRKNILVKANLKVVITPRISAANMVNLAVGIDINDFITVDPNSQTPAIRTRKVATNANVQDGGILALGGLVKINDSESVNKIPVLSDIPIFGWFAKQRGSKNTKNSLTVFISPTIIQPRLRGGASEYTKDYIALAETYAHQGRLFDSLRDPITRWFFKPDSMSEDIVHNYLRKDELKPDDIYDPKEQKLQRKERVKTALKEEPIMVENFNKQELSDQIKEKIALTENPLKNIIPGSQATAPAA